MGTPLVADQFLELLEKSGLVPPEQVFQAIERLGLRQQPAAKSIARLLVRDGLVTRFQAERLLEGRYRGFFIDHYKVLEILGAGGTACLYLAEDTNSGEQVALKVLSDKHKADAGMMTRLKLEARAGKRLKHSSIIRTFGIHQTDDVFGEVHYLVMEYVEGINLEELINLKGPIPWPQAADFTRQAAAGLQHAHTAAMVHRDVKPGNLLVDRQGSIKILDFGLAMLDTAEDADEFSLAMIFGHSCLGTADYISPEQSVDSYAVDARADIYSLGCSLYVMLTGKLPFPMASSCKKLEGHRQKSAPPLRASAPDVPEGLVEIVEKMMAKRPEDRYQTMAEVVKELAPFARREPVDFDFPKILAWRAKEARRRFAAGGLRGSAVRNRKQSSSWTIRGLPSASTKRLPQATADTSVARDDASERSAVSLVAPFEGAYEDASLSRPEEGAMAAPSGPVLVPLDDGALIPLEGDRVVIGRDDDCDVQLPFTQVSGRHCELRFDGTLWKVIDLGSKNGTQVNGHSVTEHLLLPGDRLSISRQHHFRVEYSSFVAMPGGRILYWVLMGVLAATIVLTGLYVWRLLDT